MIEPLTLEELKGIPEYLRVVWNSRDLTDGRPKAESFTEARKIFKGWLCQASHIKTITDLQGGANAILVGTNLINFVKSLE